MAASILFRSSRFARLPLSTHSTHILRSLSSAPAPRTVRDQTNASSSTWRSAILKWGILAVGGLTALWSDPLESCGIVGYVGPKDATNILMEGITILQNRGYDSAGVSTITKEEDRRIVTTKYASKQGTADSIDLLRKEVYARHKSHNIGIAHTRWATHGGKTDNNAHPHLDYKERIALVHNGTINNANEIKAELQAKGINFKSETDTEVIVQLIGSLLDETEGITIAEATKEALSRLEGTWGIVLIDVNDPNQIIAARNGSPLLIGIGDNEMFVASESSAFYRYTRDFISLKDGEMAVVCRDGSTLDFSRVQRAPEQKIKLSPHPYPHWTIKEINDQPKALGRALNFGGRIMNDKIKLGGLEEQQDRLLSIDHMLLAACGTSLYSSLYGVKLMRWLKSFNSVYAMDAAEVTLDSFPITNGGLLVVSQSGETKDVHRCLQLIENTTIPNFSIVNSVGSLIARTTGCGVYLNAGRENAVASTKAFTSQVTVLSLIAAWFAQHRSYSNQDRINKLLDSLNRLPISFGMALRTHDQCKKIAEKLVNSEHCFILGKGFAEPIALEGSLKIKEITYIHAEGYSGGALKHGPFALIEEKKNEKPPTPIILIVLDDEHAAYMRTAAEEVRARGAYTIAITDNPSLVEGLVDDVIIIPSNGPLTALLAVAPLQLIAYELAVKRGINPDVPRNLAKAVTVD